MDTYNPDDWYGMGKQQWYAFYLYRRYAGAFDRYKIVRKWHPSFVKLGLTTGPNFADITEKGTALYRKMCGAVLDDYGLPGF